MQMLMLSLLLAVMPPAASPGLPPAAQAPHVDVNSGWSMPVAPGIINAPRVQTRDVGPESMLIPAGDVPDGCEVTPALGFAYGPVAIAAFPVASYITMTLPVGHPSRGYYAAPEAGEPLRESWSAPGGEVVIRARLDDGSTQIHRVVSPSATDDGLILPHSGCWTFDVDAGNEHASIVLWVAPSGLTRRQSSRF